MSKIEQLCDGDYNELDYGICYRCGVNNCKHRIKENDEICVKRYGINDNPYESAMHYDCQICYKEGCPFRKSLSTREAQWLGTLTIVAIAAIIFWLII
jgi:hypothetical protein